MTLVCRHCEALNLDGATHCRACGGNFSLGGPRLATEIGRFWTRPIVLAAISCPIWAPIVYWPLAFLVDPSGRSEVFGKVLITLVFVVPALGAVPILASPGIPNVGKGLAIPVYYFVALIIVGVWGLFARAGWCQFLDYLKWHHCIGH